MTAATVLVAVPDRLLGDSLTMTLEDSGRMRVVEQVDDTAAALAAARRWNPALALVAADLAGAGGGVGVCADIMREECLQTLTVVYSEHGRSEQMLTALEAGALGYVTGASSVAGLLADLAGVLNGEARVPGRMLGAVLRGLVTRQRQDPGQLERYADLSRRERETLALLAQGQDHVEIAASLVISPQTARTHIQNVITKLGVHSRLEATALALEHGWVTVDGRSGT